MGSLASETRTAVDESPFLRQALRAGVLNFAAAARYLPVEGDEEALATALRRYAEELPALEPAGRDIRVRMESGIDPEIVTLETDSTDADPDEEIALTAIIASGAVDAGFLAGVLSRLSNVEVRVIRAGVTQTTAVVVVPRRDGATALRLVEQAADEPF